LKDAHGGVADVVLHHLGVGDAVFYIVSRVLEYASGAVLALVRTYDEVLANRRQVLLVQPLFALQLVLAVGKPAALPVGRVLAFEALEPELTKLGFDFALPVFRRTFLLGLAFYFLCLLRWLLLLRILLQVLRERSLE